MSRTPLTRRASNGSHLVRDDADPAFLIVGSQRSGTTLVQRLACELDEVVVPPETHFFASRFAGSLVQRQTFPLDRTTLADELQRYASLPTSRGFDLDIEAIIERLGGSCRSWGQLFGAIVRQLAGPDVPVVGEKTPGHLLWWHPLTRAMPWVKFVAVVREPRAVVASRLGVPWEGRPYHVLARRWSADQRQVKRAVTALGPTRSLLLRYEDVVSHPDGARASLATFLGFRAQGPPAPGDAAAAASLYLPWEQDWKWRAVDEITDERVDAWRRSLSPAEAAHVAAVCNREMRDFGYAEKKSGRLSPVERWHRGRYLLGSRRRQAQEARRLRPGRRRRQPALTG